MLINDKNETMNNILQRAILVGINTGGKDEVVSIENSMDELKELAEAAGAQVLHTMIQNKQKIDSAYFIGKGKADEIKILSEEMDANLIVFNDELSGAQIRNLEERIEVTVIDRATLILDIFAQRAQSMEGKLQVELAQLKYRLPRLIGLGRSLSRTGAGIGTRGPGEKKLELDRRHILDRINDIKKEIEDIKKVRDVQRMKRMKSQIPIVALVGYTNTGKSTIMNKLIEKSGGQEEKAVYVEDMLFATLDTFHRKMTLPSNDEFILIDTVGFVSKLPHGLIDAFKATLEEVLHANLLIHVIDATNENHEMQIRVTEQVLKELKVEERPTIMVYNKIDELIDKDIILPIGENMVHLSATKEIGVDRLLEQIKTMLFSENKRVTLLFPYDKGNIVSHLCEKTKICSTEYLENGIMLETHLSPVDFNKYEQYVILNHNEMTCEDQ